MTVVCLQIRLDSLDRDSWEGTYPDVTRAAICRGLAGDESLGDERGGHGHGGHRDEFKRVARDEVSVSLDTIRVIQPGTTESHGKNNERTRVCFQS